MTKRIVIELKDGDVQGIYTDIADLDVRIVKQEEDLTPVDILMSLANGSGEVEIDDRVDVSYEPDLVAKFFAQEVA